MSKPTMTIILDSDALDFIAGCESTVEEYTAHAERLAAEAGFSEVEIEEEPNVSGARGVTTDDDDVDPDSEGRWVNWHDRAEGVRREAFDAIIG